MVTKGKRSVPAYLRRRIPLLIVIMAGVIAIIALRFYSKPIPEEKPTYKGTLRLGGLYKPDIINPILVNETISATLMDMIFNGLVRLNDKFEPVPDLAESWDISGDGKVWTFHLRPGVKFHDGAELTSDDVLFTYQLITNPDIDSPWRSSYNLVERFETPDRYTFKVILKEPSALFLIRMEREIVPKHILEGVNLRDTQFNRHPIGTGPFRFLKWDENGTITLEANPEYFEGRPYLNRIVAYSNYNSLEHIWVHFIRDEVDLIWNMRFDDYRLIKDNPGFRTFVFIGNVYYALGYNLKDPLLKDKRFRDALAMGIDVQRMIKRVDKGYGSMEDGVGVRVTGPFHPNSWAFNNTVQPVPYKPREALKILKELGYEDRDGDGFLDKDGKELSIRILVDLRDERMQRVFMSLHQNLYEMGILLKPQVYDNDMKLREEFLDKGNFQTYLMIFQYAVDPDDAAKYWHSKGLVAEKWWGYNNPELDRLFDSGRVELDKDRRSKIYQEVHRIIYEDQPTLFLYTPFTFYGVSTKFGGIKRSSSYMPIWMLKDWYEIGVPVKNKRERG